MIVHAGATPSTGYYFTVIKDPVTQKIFRIDDSVVVECSRFLLDANKFVITMISCLPPVL